MECGDGAVADAEVNADGLNKVVGSTGVTLGFVATSDDEERTSTS